jgi:hypothetical protein
MLSSPATYKVAALKKSLYSLGDLAALMRTACARYLAFLSALEDRSGGSVALHRITEPARDEQHRNYSGFNFFAAGDLAVLRALLRGGYHIRGLSNWLLQRVLTGKRADKSAASRNDYDSERIHALQAVLIRASGWNAL